MALGVLGAATLPTAEAATAPAARTDTAALALTVHTVHLVTRSARICTACLRGAQLHRRRRALPGADRNRAFMDPAMPARWIAPAGLSRVPGKSGGALQHSNAHVSGMASGTEPI